MRNAVVALLLAAAAAATTAPPLAAQDTVERSVERILARAEAGRLDDVWDLGLEIGDLDGQEDTLARAIEGASGKFGPLGRLAAASGLRALSDGAVFGKQILDILTPTLESTDDAVRAAALSILSEDELFNRRVMPQVRERLVKNISDELTSPVVRIEAARSLWKVGDEDERRLAKTTLRDFLNSRERTLQVDAALALASLGTDASGPEWRVIREIADLPTARGRLAESYLRRQELMRATERHLQRILRRQLAESEAGGRSADERFDTLHEILLRVRAQHIRGEDADETGLLEDAAKGLLQGMDRHSTYFTSEEFQRFFFDLNREYGGIGAFVNFDRDGDFSIVRPIYSGPAYSAGLRSGDKILEVDGWETSGHTSDEIIAKLKGKPDTTVVLKFMRPGLTEPEDIALQRKEIQVPSVNWSMVPGNVGYVELVTFAQNTAQELRSAIEQLVANGAVGIVLDVRNNTGGYLTAARDVVELFVPGRKLVVYTQGRSEDDRIEYETRNRAVAKDIPLVVLVNEFSASASEITAGALQDHGRATIIGERSFGKGSVQSLVPLRSNPPEDFVDENRNGQRDNWEEFTDRNGNGKYDVGPHVKLTVARYHLPSGRSINKDIDRDGKVLNPDWGVVPDHELPLRATKPEDAWKNAEVFSLYRKGAFQNYVRDRIDEHAELFLELADSDAGETKRYPEFDEFFAGLETHLTTDDVRRWIRYMVRDEVADLRGKAYPGGRAVGDPQEDAQLQKGVEVILDGVGKDIREVDAYRNVLKLPG